MILTGARVSETCGMCWECVDLQKGQARVIRTMAWDLKKRPYLEETTKTSASVRVLLLSDELVRILRQTKKECQNQAGLLFIDRKGEALKYGAIQTSFSSGFKALNQGYSYLKALLCYGNFTSNEQFIGCSSEFRS